MKSYVSLKLGSHKNNDLINCNMTNEVEEIKTKSVNVYNNCTFIINGSEKKSSFWERVGKVIQALIFLIKLFLLSLGIPIS